MEITVKINVNLGELDIGRINQIGLVNSSKKLVKKAQELAPYETGTMKKGIGADPSNITTNTKETRVGPRGIVYAVRREFENKKNPSRKFYMKRTYEGAEKIVKEEFNKAVKIVTSNL